VLEEVTKIWMKMIMEELNWTISP